MKLLWVALLFDYRNINQKWTLSQNKFCQPSLDKKEMLSIWKQKYALWIELTSDAHKQRVTKKKKKDNIFWGVDNRRQTVGGDVHPKCFFVAKKKKIGQKREEKTPLCNHLISPSLDTIRGEKPLHKLIVLAIESKCFLCFVHVTKTEVRLSAYVMHISHACIQRFADLTRQ